ncbi:MAG: DUF4159 domain-containing protein [Planctomycetota bacterium]
MKRIRTTVRRRRNIISWCDIKDGIMKEGKSHLNRREFLGGTGKIIAGAALTGGVLGSVNPKVSAAKVLDDLDRYDFIMPRVKFACGSKSPHQWNAYPGGDRNLLEAFEKVVKCRVKLCPGTRGNIPEHGAPKHFNAVVDFKDMNQLRKYPFLFMTASCGYKFDMRQKLNLKEYISAGGYLLMDDCVAYDVEECSCKKVLNGDHFYKSSCKLLRMVFGESVRVVDKSHEIFHNVYDLSEIGLPYIQGKQHPPVGVFVGERLAVFLSSTDIHCGWADNDGEWFGRNSRKKRKIKEGLGRHGHKEAIMMGVNILMYALTH